MNLRADVIIFLICISQIVGQNVSPRKVMTDYLASQGCTNLVVSKFIIDAAKTGVTASTVYNRLRGVIPSTIILSQITTWYVLVLGFCGDLIFPG